MYNTSPLSSLFKKIVVGLHGSLHANLPAVRLKKTGEKTINACIFSIGERTEAQAIASLQNQTLPLSHIELIKNVCPISAASNHALDLAYNADFLLWVDADMVLYANCTEHLVRLIRPDTLYAVAPLIDPVFGNVGYIKLLNMHIVKRLNMRFREVLGCDVDFCRQAQRKMTALLLIPIPYFANPSESITQHTRPRSSSGKIKSRKKRGGTESMGSSCSCSLENISSHPTRFCSQVC